MVRHLPHCRIDGRHGDAQRCGYRPVSAYLRYETGNRVRLFALGDRGTHRRRSVSCRALPVGLQPESVDRGIEDSIWLRALRPAAAKALACASTAYFASLRARLTPCARYSLTFLTVSASNSAPCSAAASVT